MTRNEFILEVRRRLTGLPETDVQNALDFYLEAIDDHIEDGLTEDQAVAAVGTPDEISGKILMETPLPTLIRTQPEVKPRRTLRAWEIVLIILGSPVWLPIAIAVAAVALALAVTVLAIILAIIISVIALAIGGVAGAVASLIGLVMGKGSTYLLQFAIFLVITGVALLLFIPLKAGFVWFMELIGRTIQRIKLHFVQKRALKDESMM